MCGRLLEIYFCLFSLFIIFLKICLKKKILIISFLSLCVTNSSNFYPFLTLFISFLLLLFFFWDLIKIVKQRLRLWLCMMKPICIYAFYFLSQERRPRCYQLVFVIMPGPSIFSNAKRQLTVTSHIFSPDFHTIIFFNNRR